MSTKRLLVSLDTSVLHRIIELAKYNNTSSSKIARQLINTSLELQEDQLFSDIADYRAENTKQWISHDNAWK